MVLDIQHSLDRISTYQKISTYTGQPDLYPDQDLNQLFQP